MYGRQFPRNYIPSFKSPFLAEVDLGTVWYNQMGTVFAEMSSWTAGYNEDVISDQKYEKTNILGSFLWRFLNFRSD